MDGACDAGDEACSSTSDAGTCDPAGCRAQAGASTDDEYARRRRMTCSIDREEPGSERGRCHDRGLDRSGRRITYSVEEVSPQLQPGGPEMSQSCGSAGAVLAVASGSARAPPRAGNWVRAEPL